MNKQMREILEEQNGIEAKKKELDQKREVARAEGRKFLEAQANTDEEKESNYKKAKEFSNQVKDYSAQIEGLDTQIKNLQEKYEIEKQLFENKKEEVIMDNNKKNEINNKELEVKVFAKVMAGKQITDEKEIKALSTLTDSEGKLLIPVDVQTRINEFMRDYPDLGRYVNVESVTTLSGSRVYEVDADAVALDGVAELTTIPDMAGPTFQKISYAIQYFKGMIEIPNELIKNETGGLIDYLARWIAKKIVATNNALILYADGTKAQGVLGVTSNGFVIEELATKVTVKKLKSILNKNLPTAIVNSPNCMIVTNQDGFQLLDELEETGGKPLLQPDITQPTIQRVKGKQVLVLPNNVLLTKDFAGTDKAPFIFGNMQEALTLFNRQGTQIDTSDVAGFKNDATVTRVITGKDTKFVDKKALYIAYSPIA